MKILFLPKYHEEGPSSRYRTYKYLTYFKERHHDYVVKPLFRDGYVKKLYSGRSNFVLDRIVDYLRRIRYVIKFGHEYDLLVIEKELFPYIPYFFEYILLYNRKYTLDYDDAISVRYRRNLLTKVILKNKINKLAKYAELITVGNHWYWSEINSTKLEYLPTVIDTNDYRISDTKTENNIIPIIVWIGSPSTERYLKVLEGALLQLSKIYSFKLRIIGSEFQIDGLDVEYLKWSAEKEFEYLFHSDIGIMPLTSSEWEKGKCGFKLLQYMAAGLPVVGSDAPANQEIIAHNINGFIARTNSDWYDYLEKLIISSDMRKTFGTAGKLNVVRNYSYKTWGNRYVQMLENLFEKNYDK